MRLFLLLFLITSIPTHAELIYQFKNPAFNGQGWSNHVLTIDSIENSRRDSVEAKRKAEIARAENEFNNTPLNRFMNLFQSQLYSQLATQLSNNLFQNKCMNPDGSSIPGCTNPTNGSFNLDGNTVTWNKGSSEIMLTVVDSKGTMTMITVPIASFSF